MSKRLRKLLCALLLCALTLPCLAPSAMASVGVRVYTSSARFYRSKSTSSASVRLPKGYSLKLQGISGKWAKVSCKGHSGYMLVKNLITKKRYAAYVSENTHIYSKASSSSSGVSVSRGSKIYVVGKSGDYYRVKVSGKIGYVRASAVTASKPRTSSSSSVRKKSSSSWKRKVVKLNWFDSGKYAFGRGDYGYLYDIDTGISLRIKRMGGTNHADCEPATRRDTAKLKKIAGGSFSWKTHACILYTGGKYIACAINTMPHGKQTISSNGYNGQFCLHMSGSLTHGTHRTNSEHQSAIRRAYNWAH